MVKRRKNADAARIQQVRALALLGIIVLVALVSVLALYPKAEPAGELPLDVEDDNPARFQELQQLEPEGTGWLEGLASACSLETNDGWDATASGIPLNNHSLTVAVPQEDKDLLGRTVQIFYAGKTVEAKVTDTGALGPLGRSLDLSPATWRAFGADSLSDWGVREVHYRFVAA